MIDNKINFEKELQNLDTSTDYHLGALWARLFVEDAPACPGQEVLPVLRRTLENELTREQQRVQRLQAISDRIGELKADLYN